MHAYLIIGKKVKEVDKKAEEIINKLGSKRVNFEIGKIDDVRKLNSFTKLNISTPTTIFINNIDQASIPATNAFLKNLEEPQESISYILTASSIYKVLPTIVSRCHVIKISGHEDSSNKKEVYKFLKMSQGNKLLYIDKVKKREDAASFIEDVIITLHNSLHSNEPKDISPFNTRNRKNTIVILESANKTLLALKANGNVGLQLTNFVINSTQ